MRIASRAPVGLLLLSILVCPQLARAQTAIGGPLTSSLTLGLAGSPYVVTSDLIVRNGATLTFQAGVTVRVGAGVSLIVENGALRVLGTPQARVLITSFADVPNGTPAPGDWGFLRFLDGTVDALTRLEQVDLRFGQGVTIQGASPDIESASIQAMAGPAVSIDLASFPTGSGNSASNNALNAILVASGEMTVPGSWSLKGIPYVLQGPVSIGAAPAISGVTPVNVEQDSATPASIAGLRLDGAASVAFSGTGVAGQILLGGTSTALPILVTVDPAAPLGTRTFTVDAAAGLTPSGAVVVNVVPGTPVIQSLAPPVAPAGAPDTSVVITGRKFNATSVVRVNGTGVSSHFDSATQITATIPAASLVSPATLSITVANPDPQNPGQFLVSFPSSFTVSTPPAVASVTPDHGARGTVVNAAIGGSNLLGATSVVFSGTGVTATVQAGGTATNLPIQITIDPGAATGSRTFTVTTPAGSAPSGPAVFTVTVPVPAVTSISPSFGILSTGALTITVTGSSFDAAAVVQFNGIDRTTHFSSATKVTADLVAADLASLGTFLVRVVNVDAGNPGQSQPSNAISFQILQPSLSLSPSPMGVAALSSATLTVTLSIPAPLGGVNVTLTPFQALVATVNGSTTATIVVPEGHTQGTVSVDGVILIGGSTTITATAGGFVSANVTVNVSAAPRIDVTPASLLVGLGRSANVTVTSSVAAQQGGLSVNLVASPGGVFTTAASVTIPQGATSIQAAVTGAAVGTANLHGAVTGFAVGATCDVTVRQIQIVLPGSLIVSPGLSRPFSVALTDPAPAGGTTVNFLSSNPAAADPPASIVIPAGGMTGSATIAGKIAGATTITATDPAAGFQNGTMTVNVQAVNITFAPSSGSSFKGAAFGLHPSVFINAAAPAGGQTIDLASSDTTVATVPASVTIPQGQTSAVVNVAAVGAGSATITPSAPGLNATGTFAVTVVDTFLSFSTNVGSFGLRTIDGVRNGALSISLPGAAPSSLDVQVSAADPNVALIAPFNTAVVPSSPITLTIPAGSSSVNFDLVGRGIADFTDLSTPLGIVVTPGTGDVFISENGNDRIRRVDGATGIITTFAGTSEGFGGDGGQATAAQLANPVDIARDAAGNLFVADQANHRIRRIDAQTNVITTVAGNPSFSCSQTRDGQIATSAGLCNPSGVAFDAAGALYIADQSFHRIRRVDPGADGVVTGAADEFITTVAGNGSCAFAGDAGPATAASICNPTGVAFDPADGSLFIADLSNNRVRRVTTGSDSAVTGAAGEIISTIAGSASFACNNPRDGQPATAAGLCSPVRVAFDASNRLYISDRDWHRVRRAETGADAFFTGAADEILSTVAGTGSCTFDGNGKPATLASICSPHSIALTAAGQVLFADASNHQVRRLDPATGLISTFAGSGEAGLKGDGASSIGQQILVAAPGFTPNSAPIAVLPATLQFTGIETIRNTLSAPDDFTFRIGNPSLGFGFRAAQPFTIVVASSNPGAVSVPASVDFADNASSTPTIFATVAGPGTANLTGTVSPSTPTIGPIAAAAATTTITSATLGVNSDPLGANSDSRMFTGAAVRNGNFNAFISGPAPVGGVTVHLAVSDPNFALLAPFNTTAAGTGALDVAIPAGSRTSASFDLIGVRALSAVLLANPLGVAVDGTGAIFIADTTNHRVRRVDAATGILTTVAGNGACAFAGDGGPASSSSLCNPEGVALDSQGDLFIADLSNQRIRRVDHASGKISTVVGNGSCSFFGDGGPSTSARVCNPVGLAFDATGALLIGDQGNHRIRRVVVGANAGITGDADEVINTVAGNGSCTFAGDNGPARSASLCSPIGVAVDTDGALLIGDQSNNRVRRVSVGTDAVVAGDPNDAANEIITTVVGNGTAGSGGDGGPATSASLNNPWNVSVTASGDLLIADRGNHRIRKVARGANAGVTGESDEVITTLAGTGGCGFNGDGQLATLAGLCNPGQAIEVPGSGGDVLIADESLQRIRKVEGATGIIRTTVGTGPAGFGGDGGPGAGVRITATASGFTSNDAQASVDATNLVLSGLSTFRNTLSSTNGFSLFLHSPNLGNSLRSASPLVIDVTASDPNVEAFQPGNAPSTTVAIASNATLSSQATLGVVGAGTMTVAAAVDANTPPVGPIAGTSAGVTIVAATLGVNSDPLSANGDSRVQTGTGVRNGSFSAFISGAAPAGGVTVHLAVSDPSKALLAPFNTTTAGAAALDVTIPAGSRTSSGFDLIGVGAVSAVQLNNPLGVARDPNGGSLYIADTSNHRVRKVDGATGVITTLAGNGTCAFAGDGGPASSSSLCNPEGVAVDAAGNVLIADVSNRRIRRVDHATGKISTVVGDGSCRFFGDGGPATSSSLCNPVGLAFDATGALLIGDQGNHRIRRVVVGANAGITGDADEVITTVAGNGSCAFAGDNGPARSASLCSPIGVAVDTDGALLIGDQSNNRVRRVSVGTDAVVAGDPNDAANEIITTVVGNGTAGAGGDGGPATSANLNAPFHVSVDASGNLLIADRSNHRIRKVARGANAGVTGESDEVITTLAGTGGCGFNGDGQLATLAGLCNPGQAIEVPGSGGDVLIADESLQRIRKVEGATGIIRTTVGTGPQGFGGDGGPGAGVRITATASGFDSNDAQADVRQSTFHLFPATTSISALSTTFSVGIDPNGLGCCQRASEAVSIDVAASDPTVLNPATPLSIASNASSTGSQALNTVGAGVATLVASTLGAAINPGNSAAINVLPTIASIAPLAGQAGTTANVAIVGTNLSNASSVTVSGTGVSVGLVGKTNTEIDLTFTIDPLAEPATRTVTVATPGGSVTTGFLVTAATLTTARLTDMTQFLANSSGATTGTFFHNTNVDTQAFQLGVTSPAVALPSGTAVSFLNPGAEDINLPLSLGTNTFTIVGDQTTASSPFGLNLFFNDEVIPGITVFNANGGTGAFSIEAPETSTTGFATGGPGPVPASGVTSAATSDGFAVTLTSYTMKSSSSPFVDLMNGFTAGSSNGTADTVGSFTLDVTRPGNFQPFAVQGSAAPAGFDALSPPGSRTTITFDDPNFPDGSANPALAAGARGVEITTQYASLGVSFGSAAGNIRSFVFGAFGGLITTKSLGNDNFSFQGPIAATFTTVKSSVGVIVTDGDAPVGAATLTAYSGPNGTGVALASVSSPGGTGNDPFFLGLVDTGGSPRIRSVIVRFQRVSGSDLTADNLTFAP